MKKQVEIMIIFAIFLMLLPCLAFLNKNQQPKAIYSSDTVKILFTKENKVSEISMEDYLVGAVLAQMPSSFEPEALKAQAVLAHTYIVSRQQAEKDSPTSSLKGAYISDNTSVYQSYYTPEQAKEHYGDDYDDAKKNVTKAVKAVENQILVYAGEPIFVAFHAVSCGCTESSKDMWGIDIPYLVSVKSSWDKNKKGFEKTTEFTADELSALLSKHFKNIDVDLNKDIIEIESTSDNGSVISIDVNGTKLSGTEFSNALSLPSPCFSFTLKNDTYTFTTKGYGHLVGMSQYGANAMAKDSKTFEEILSYYFPHTSIQAI